MSDPASQPEPRDDDKERSKLVRNERVRLTATVVNTCAAGVFVTGFIAQITPVLYGGVIPHSPLWRVIALSSIAVACVMHLLARWIIGDLRP